MKVRSNRTHLMGISNRDNTLIQQSTKQKTQNIFQKSINKSKSLVPKLSSSTSITNKQKSSNIRIKPFQGFHHQFSNSRFDINNIKPYQQQIPKPYQQTKITSFQSYLNHDIKNIQQQFVDKTINLKKISQLKNTLITNNKNKRNLKSYFDKFANNGIINKNGLKSIVKQYGYDINEDQVNLILKLTHYSNHSQQYTDFLKLDTFIQLMTKDNIFYRTLQLPTLTNPNEITLNKNFTQKVHLILRNKFITLKQAFNIYIKRNEDIGIKQYNYVMKKLDITDLIVTKNQRQQVFKKYSNDKGKLNVQALLCAIIQQQNNNTSKNNQYCSFVADLQVNQERKFINSQKIRNFSLKNLSITQYQCQYQKARAVIEQLNILRTKKKQNNQDIDIYKNMFKNNIVSQNEVITNTQKLLKNEGINFSKQDYQAFAAYLNYDTNTQITQTKINQLIFQQPQHIAKDRFQRRVRLQAPQIQKQITNQLNAQVDLVAAQKSIKKLKLHNLHPQSRQHFKFFDIDKDGYISKKQFKQRIQSLNIMQNYELQNLINHLNLNTNGSINYQDFAKKISDPVEVVINDDNFLKSKNWQQATKLKKTFIQQSKETSYQQNTRHSAWPTNLYIPDLSLIQPSKNTGLYLSQAQRFTQRRQDYAKNQKMQALAKTQNKIKKITQWNKILQQRIQVQRQKQQQKQAAKAYKSKLAAQKYQFECHK